MHFSRHISAAATTATAASPRGAKLMFIRCEMHKSVRSACKCSCIQNALVTAAANKQVTRFTRHRYAV